MKFILNSTLDKVEVKVEVGVWQKEKDFFFIEELIKMFKTMVSQKVHFAIIYHW